MRFAIWPARAAPRAFSCNCLPAAICRWQPTSAASGVLADVQGTPLDWRQPRRVGDAVAQPLDRWRVAGGLDLSWWPEKTAPSAPSAAAPPALPGLPAPPAPPGLRLAALLSAPISGPPIPLCSFPPPPRPPGLAPGSAVGRADQRPLDAVVEHRARRASVCRPWPEGRSGARSGAWRRGRRLALT